MQQIVYVSFSSVPENAADLAGILTQSRHNNAIDGITGLLWSDGRSFLQVLEGPRASVEPCFSRIVQDSRHHFIRVLLDSRITAHQFGGWNMVHHRAGDQPDLHDIQMNRLLTNASHNVRAQFSTLVATSNVGT
ncbi:BLUF domain-containing protein [Sphingomonas sp. 22R3R2A-7]|uniref:BLUF domain-containing protein n=1 Tax=Sphingomonas sp. 22R3R2A-7 TaxID=3050230 RepID=UPI002FE03ADB